MTSGYVACAAVPTSVVPGIRLSGRAGDCVHASRVRSTIGPWRAGSDPRIAEVSPGEAPQS